MPDKTTVECPNCKNVAQTAHSLRAGAKVHCPRCKSSFRFSPTERDEGNPDAELRSIGDVDLREFFTPEAPPTTVSTKPIERSNGNGKGNGIVRERKRGATDQPFVQDPHANRSARTKDVFIGGKKVRFVASRKGTAVVLIFLLLALGYGGIVCVGYFMDYLDFVAKGKQQAQEKLFADQKEKARAKAGIKDVIPEEILRPEKIVSPEKPKVVIPEEPPTEAGKPRRIGEMEVRVAEAGVGIFEKGQTEPRLVITLKVTNHSKQRMRYRSWSDPANKVELRDGTPAVNKYSLVGAPAKKEWDVEPGAMTEDILVFPAPPPLYGVNLVLPLGTGGERFRFSLPREFIQRFQ
jgi:hypothetical protein